MDERPGDEGGRVDCVRALDGARWREEAGHACGEAEVQGGRGLRGGGPDIKGIVESWTLFPFHALHGEGRSMERDGRRAVMVAYSEHAGKGMITPLILGDTPETAARVFEVLVDVASRR